MVKKSSLPFNDENINLFITRFSTSAYTLQSCDNQGKVTFTASEKTHLTSDVVKNHLGGDITLASYVINERNECKFLVLDFDIETIISKDAFIKSDKKSREKKEEAFARIREKITRTIKAASEKLGIERNQLLIERSGCKGYHVWMFLANHRLAVDVYKMTRIIASELDLQALEIFPKQASISANGGGSLIKIPLGIHRKTYERCLLLDDAFEPILDQWQALNDVVPVTDEQINNILKLRDTETERIEDDGIDDVTKFGGSIEKMIEKCEALQVLKQRAEFPDEGTGVVNLNNCERVCLASLFKKFGDAGRAKLHQFLHLTHNYDQEKTDKAFTTWSTKPQTCKSMMEKGICRKECEAIINSGGKSPIKLSTEGRARAASEATILYSLSEIENPLLRNRRIRADFVVTALTDNPYGSTRKCTFKACTEQTCNKFNDCKVEDKDEQKVVTIGPDRKEHIEVYGEPDSKVRSVLRSKVQGCQNARSLCTESSDTYLVQPFACANVIKMSGQIQERPKDDGTESKEDKEQKITAAKEMKDYIAFFLGNSLETSKVYRGWGTVLLNPQNQALTVLFDKVEPLCGNIDTFEVNDSNRQMFEVLKAMPLHEKIFDIAENVTKVRNRDELIIATLLTHMSPINLRFNNAKVQRGWLECVLIGDTGQAKSTLTGQIINHIGLGRIEGSNTSLAGLLGGVNKLQNKSYISWGVLPKCNKGFLFIDEVQNMAPETWGNIRTVRSTGVAKVTKIIQGEHEAKVRLMCAANPKPNDKMLDDFKYGALALSSVMLPADIRRFDFAVFLSKKDVDQNAANRVNEETIPVITSEMWTQHCLWAWSRKEENFIWTRDLTIKILEAAKAISDKYGNSSDVPLCNASDMREKLARMVASFAVLNLRTPDFVNVHPEEEDLRLTIEFLEQIYSNENVALDMDSADKRRESVIDEDQYSELKAKMKDPEYKGMSKVVEGFRDVSEIRVLDLSSWSSVEVTAVSKVITLLAKHQMVEPGRFGAYKPKPKLLRFIKMLKREKETEDDM